MKYLLGFFFFSVLFISCDKSNEQDFPDVSDGTIFGYWIFHDMEDDVYVMVKSDSFSTDKYGFAFFTNCSYSEHKNSDGCGTPPIVYRAYSGNWEYLSDSLYNISVDYWGGEIDYQLEILHMEGNTLRCRFDY